MTETQTLVAPCGCTFTGRFYTTWDCSQLDQETVTGHQRMLHALKTERKLKKNK